MENAFKSIMAGGDDASRAQAQDFIQRVTTGSPLEGFSDDDVKESAKILQSLTPEQRKRALGASLQNINANVTGDQRASLNEMLKQREAGKGLIDITRSGESVQAGTDRGGDAGGGLDDLLGGLLGGGGSGGGGLEDILGDILGGGQVQQQPQGGGGGLGDILGGLLGGGGSSSGGGGLGGMLGGLLGGGKSADSGASAGGLDDMLGQILGGGGGTAAAQDSDSGLLGGLLSGPLGKAILAGAAGYAMKEIMGK